MKGLFSLSSNYTYLIMHMYTVEPVLSGQLQVKKSQKFLPLISVIFTSIAQSRSPFYYVPMDCFYCLDLYLMVTS